MTRQITNNQSIMLEGTASFDGINVSPNKNGEEEVKKIRWWKKLLDLKEARTQVLFSLPIILTNIFYYSITLISVMFAGHLGQLQLAGATLANSWASATGFAFMVGLSGSLETLCGQGFGAKLYRMLGIYLQASCLLSLCFSTILAIIWFYTEPILIFIHQDPHISATAALYIKYLIPGLFAYGFLQNILRFLQTQSVVFPLVLFSLIPMCIHIGITYYLVHFTHLGFKGAPLATSISLWISVIMLSSYVICTKKFKHTWTGFSMESFSYFLVNLKLALPSAGMICLEYWAFEILVFLAGVMPNSEISTSLLAMCLSTQSVAYMLNYGVSAAASTRVSNELGAGEPGRAKNAMFVTLKLSVFAALLSATALGFGHNAWAGLFTDNILIKKQFATLVPLLATSIAIDSVQNVVAGAMRGCGWQHLAVYINLAAFYLIGIPLGCLLGFKFKLYVRGLWGGLVSGLFCDAIILLFIVLRKKWEVADLSTSTSISKEQSSAPV